MIPVRDGPWLAVPLGRRCRTLGWCVNAPGFAAADTVHWREVRDADLGVGLDVGAWLAAEMAAAGRRGPCFLTSRAIGRFERRADGPAAVVATVGLGNAERIGAPMGGGPGTVNILARLDAPLSEGALVEALSLVAEARTAAVMEHGPDARGGRATGTGTDCILVAAPPGAGRHAGKHTPLGTALGRAVYEAVAAGTRAWMEEFG